MYGSVIGDFPLNMKVEMLINIILYFPNMLLSRGKVTEYGHSRYRRNHKSYKIIVMKRYS